MMKKGLFSTPAIVVLVAVSMAQVASQPPAPSAKPDSPQVQQPAAPASSGNQLAPGTLLSVELSKSLDAKKSKANDRIEAKTAIDLLAHGQIVVPRNTKVIGRVTEAKPRSKESPDSLIGVTFDRMLLKDGREVPLQLTVQAVARPLPVWSTLPATAPGAESPAIPPMVGQRPTMGSSPAPAGYPTAAGDSGLPPDMAPSDTSTPSPLNPTSRGVVGIKGLSLDASGPAAVFTSTTGNVHLDSGAQLILRVQ